jgi:hypothetical protein
MDRRLRIVSVTNNASKITTSKAPMTMKAPDPALVSSSTSTSISTSHHHQHHHHQQQHQHQQQQQQQQQQQTAEDEDDFDIAFAAEAAANAVEAADAEQQRLDESMLRCRICGQGRIEGRPILRFLPVPHDVHAATAAPSVVSFPQDICLHIFCGKTASILPSVNQPELEILTKAGLKNKHGIGPEVNAALARTRCAVLAQEGAAGAGAAGTTNTNTTGTSGTGTSSTTSTSASSASNSSKEKQYYLVREFEAHLAAIRHTHINFISEGGSSNSGSGNTTNTNNNNLNNNNNPTANGGGDPYTQTQTSNTTTARPMKTQQALLRPTVIQQAPPQQQRASQLNHYFDPTKGVPVRAAAGMIQKPTTTSSTSSTSTSRSRRQVMPIIPLEHQHQQQHQHQHQHQQGLPTTEDGYKVRCGCGGMHWPAGTSRGVASWRNHVMTKRHQKWMEDTGLLGQV